MATLKVKFFSQNFIGRLLPSQSPPHVYAPAHYFTAIKSITRNFLLPFSSEYFRTVNSRHDKTVITFFRLGQQWITWFLTLASPFFLLSPVFFILVLRMFPSSFLPGVVFLVVSNWRASSFLISIVFIVDACHILGKCLVVLVTSN